VSVTGQNILHEKRKRDLTLLLALGVMGDIEVARNMLLTHVNEFQALLRAIRKTDYNRYLARSKWKTGMGLLCLN
jgi:hypothetical protein